MKAILLCTQFYISYLMIYRSLSYRAQHQPGPIACHASLFSCSAVASADSAWAWIRFVCSIAASSELLLACNKRRFLYFGSALVLQQSLKAHIGYNLILAFSKGISFGQTSCIDLQLGTSMPGRQQTTTQWSSDACMSAQVILHYMCACVVSQRPLLTSSSSCICSTSSLRV